MDSPLQPGNSEKPNLHAEISTPEANSNPIPTSKFKGFIGKLGRKGTDSDHLLPANTNHRLPKQSEVDEGLDRYKDENSFFENAEHQMRQHEIAQEFEVQTDNDNESKVA